MKQRLEYIDIMRGIAILLVVFEHCIGSLKEPFAGFILSFHMPLFFFISGACLKNGGGKNVLVKKVKTILLPQVTLGVTCIATTILFDVCLKRSLDFSDVNYIAAFDNWFLPTLFLMDMIIIPIITFIRNKRLIALIALLVFVIFAFTDYKELHYVQQTLVATVFGIMGYLTRGYCDKFNEISSKFKGFGWIALLMVALISAYNDPVGMYINQYGNKLLFLLASVLGIYGVYDLAISAKNTAFLQWCGRQSIIIYILQFALIRVVIAATGMIIPNFDFDTYPFYILSFLLTLIMLVPTTLFCNKYLKFAFGK